MTLFKGLIILLPMALAPLSAYASLIHFDLRAPVVESLDGSTQFNYQSAGLTATVAANVGVLNRTGSGFGVDIVGSGCDNSDAIDMSCSGAIGESISVWFDQRVRLISAEISGLTGGDTARWTLPGFSFQDFTTAGEYSAGASVYLDAGQRFSWTSITDNTTSTQRGFSFDGFTVSTASAQPVFEPATTILFSIGLVLVILRRKRRLNRSTDDYLFDA